MADDFEKKISEGDLRESLVAMRDLVAHELAANRCKNCQSLQMRSGDTAALVLRLQKLIEEIAQLPDQNAEVSELDRIRARRDRASAAEDSASPELGSKRSPRRQGGRTPRFKSGP